MTEMTGATRLDDHPPKDTRSLFENFADRERAEQKLRHSEERYRDLYERTPVMMHSIDNEGRLVSVNEYWLEMLGYERSEVIGRRSTEFLTEASRRYALEVALPEFLKTGVASDVEYQMVKKNGDVIDILLSAISQRDQSGEIEHTRAFIVDVTERKQAEEELRQSQRRYRRLVELSPEAILVHANWRILYVNPAGIRLLGGEREEDILGKSVIDFVHAADTQAVEDRIQKVYRGEDAAPLEWKLSVEIVVRKDAEQRAYRLNEQLRALSLRHQAIREDERTRIAREIHDELGTTLTALRMDLSWLERRLSEPTDAEHPDRRPPEIRSMIGLVDSTIQSVRRIATELRPAVLDEFGLVAAIEWQTQDFQRRTGTRCTATLPESEIPVDPEKSTAIFRICQESLTNVIRHARATHVEVSVVSDGHDLILTVKDDGRGITQAQIDSPGALRLLGIKERALGLGGSVDVQGEAGEGTTITVTIPLADSEYAHSSAAEPVPSPAD